MHRKTVLLVLLLLAGCGGEPSTPAAAEDQAALTVAQRAVSDFIREADAMRSGLAAGIADLDDVNQETFEQVCKPVGMRLKQTGQEKGWKIGQVAVRYRNPANEPDSVAAGLFSRFESDASLDSLWLRTESDEVPGWRYLRRITIEPACLACHGERDARPAFVKENYPEDRAFGFEKGDLRGLYSVFVRDSPI